MNAVAISTTEPAYMQATRSTDTNRYQNDIRPVAIQTESASTENPVDQVVSKSSEEDSDTYTYNSRGEMQHPKSSGSTHRRVNAKV